jgi:alanine dehydrogenase
MTKHLQILFLNQDEIRKLLSVNDAIECVEYAFKMHALRRVQMPSKIYLNYTKYDGDLRAMPAYIEPLGASGVKVVNVHTRNKNIGLPTVMAVFVLIDPATGTPLSVMDATFITDLRTGAAGAVAVKYLARRNSSVLGLVGAGRQARLQLLSISRVKKLSRVKVCALTYEEAEEFVRKIKKEIKIQIEPCKIEEVCNSDIISTTTPVRNPIVKNEWIKSGTHINAIGADAPGKQELEVEILKRARIFLDDYEQATHSGEVNSGFSKGELSKENITGEIGEVLIGKKKGRISNNDITVFDSTGLAVQDVALAFRVYKKALKNKMGKVLRLF